MQEEIRFATFNVCNLAPPGVKLYDNLEPLTPEGYDAKANWIAQQLDQLDADVIGFQEIFSQAALRDVLSRTRKYGNALHAGFDPDPQAHRLTPSVAIVSRLPFAGQPAIYASFPEDVPCDSGNPDADRFARAPLHVQVVLPGERIVDVVVVHLKSRRPDYRRGDSGEDPLHYAMASLRSLVWRGTEAVALRVLLSKMMRETRRACVVLGDFNDTADAVTTTIVLGTGGTRSNGSGAQGVDGALVEERRGRLYDSNQIQLRQDHLRHVGYTSIHEGHYSTIDHVLVSEEFNPHSPRAIGEVVDVSYFNDHLRLDRPEASDHGQVLVRMRLY
ncbi:endonuclease/exonuclease/phosphatase family protein [Pseudoduganella umbonata]|uniref:Endonuclease/exonuclease/phosphatase family metal-dependent hydrolase n=1 Tax=Pseudoduganella umbonata TaxID=864828 RepID=A0A4P8HTM2_9BURK|nr:endonuclease/exonuclease/phosphatase family protein [Pseudoduganella umbonata]MBB3220796.1 endonuclease/exonuclease/phosphatase family metal-dependent hydrolase [Pseudoduganella umbonata]QCP11735.1 endonuclease/exonuclease/phosphatase family protein [Pseudoduganella umbonata]